MANDFEADYTFDRFVVTPYNGLAFEAAQTIVREAGTRYNPFFLHGGIWSGKTHLLHAIGNAIRKERDDIRLFYVSGRVFGADIAYALKKHKLTNFYRNYQNHDFLMIDGFDALVDKDVEQNVVMRLFDAMRKQKRQIIVTSGLPFHHFPIIEEYFRSSCGMGLMADILAPEGLAANPTLLWD